MTQSELAQRARQAAEVIVSEFAPLLGEVGNPDDDCTETIKDIIMEIFGGLSNN
jgi:hypothetical protein